MTTLETYNHIKKTLTSYFKPKEVEDMIEEVFLWFLTHQDKYYAGKQVIIWRGLDFLRSDESKKFTLCELDELPENPGKDFSDLEEALERVDLSQQEFEVIFYRYHQGLSCYDTSYFMKISENKVKQLTKTALETLRKELENE